MPKPLKKQSMDFYLFQDAAAFFGTGEGGSSTSTAEYRTSGMLPFSWKWSRMTSCLLLLLWHPRKEDTAYLQVTLGFQGLTAFARPCESSALFTVVLDQDYLETLPREVDLASLSYVVSLAHFSS